MDKREEFLKLGYKKDVLKEIFGILESTEVSQPVEIFLFKDGKLFDLTCDDASFFEEIVVNSVREFVKELESNDLAEVQSYEDSIYDKRFLYLEKQEVLQVVDIESRLLSGTSLYRLDKSVFKDYKNFDIIVKYFYREIGANIIGFQELDSRHIFDVKRLFFLDSADLKSRDRGIILKPKEFFDYFVVGDILFIRSVYYFENKFQFFKKYVTSKDEFVKEIKANNNVLGKDIRLKGIDYFDKYVSERKTFLKKLHGIYKKGNYVNFEFEKLKEVITNFNLKINLVESNNEIVLDEKTSIKDFLDLLSELYYVSFLSEDRLKANESVRL